MHSGEQLKTKPDQFVVRLPSGQREQIKARAAKNRRAMNSEILILIEAGIRALDGQDMNV